MRTERIAFLGAGNMAEAILGGLLAGDLVPASQIVASDISEKRRTYLSVEYGVEMVEDNAEAVRGADVVILAMKPQQVPEALAAIKESFSDKQLLISICAGLPTAALESWVPARVARVMPNLPALVRRGVSAICGGTRSTAADLDLVEVLFKATGIVVRLAENQMNEVTALSGSGPGYVFAFIEAIIAAAVQMGIEPATAREMAVETVRGAAELAVDSGEDPAELRRRVSSKGGTTLAGLAAMEAGGFSEAIAAGMKACRDRAAELAGS